MPVSRRLTIMLLALLIALGNGWEAKVHFTHSPPRKAGGVDGKIHVDGGRVRVEEPTPLGSTVILAADGKVRLLFPATKQFMEIDPGQSALATAPPVSLEGMKKVGEERLAGRACDIWEKTEQTLAGRIQQRLWVPRGAKPFVFLRFVTQTDRGATKADVTEIREAAQPASLFEVPKDYARK